MSTFTLDSMHVIIFGATIFISSIESPIGATSAFTGGRHCIFRWQLIIVDEHINIRVVVSISTSNRPCHDDRLYSWQRGVNVRVALREPQKHGTRFIGIVHSVFFHYLLSCRLISPVLVFMVTVVLPPPPTFPWKLSPLKS